MGISQKWNEGLQKKWTCKMDQSFYASKKETWIKRIRCLQKRYQILQRSHENLQSLIFIWKAYDALLLKEVNKKKMCFSTHFLLTPCKFDWSMEKCRRVKSCTCK